MNNKAKIAIIEIDGHPEVLRNTLNILTQIPVNCELFTTKSIWNDVKLDEELLNINIHFIDNKSRLKRFFRSKLEIINSCDLVFFYTLVDNYKTFVKLNIEPPIVLLVHNANSYLKPFKNLKVNFSYHFFRKDIPYILYNVIFKLDLFYRSIFIKNKTNFLCFPSLEITDYVKQNNFLPAKKIISEFPLVYSKILYKKPTISSTITISIIGNVEKRRRDYNAVYKAFKKLLQKTDKNIEIVLLGRPVGMYGKSMIKKFKSLKNKNCKITCFNSFIHQEKFEDYLQKTHFLIIPVAKQTRYKIFEEIYSFTKISGNINDMLVYNKPAIVPSSYRLPEKLIPVVKTYNEKYNIQMAILDWINSQDYLNLDFSPIEKEYNINNAANKASTVINTIVRKYSSPTLGKKIIL